MAFILVPPDQKRIELKKLDAQAESDKGPYPIPDNLPIEGWPVGYQGMTLDDVQRDKANIGGDRHGIIVDPVNRMLWEFWLTKKVAGGWVANQASIFDLKTNKLRPDGWTSADAAGLPIFPAVVRYDELKRGVIDHALRVSVRNTRRDYVAPATHYASPHTNEEYPRMGERIRLRRDFDISGFSPSVQVILKALKRYGMFVADNGLEWCHLGGARRADPRDARGAAEGQGLGLRSGRGALGRHGTATYSPRSKHSGRTPGTRVPGGRCPRAADSPGFPTASTP